MYTDVYRVGRAVQPEAGCDAPYVANYLPAAHRVPARGRHTLCGRDDVHWNRHVVVAKARKATCLLLTPYGRTSVIRNPYSGTNVWDVGWDLGNRPVPYNRGLPVLSKWVRCIHLSCNRQPRRDFVCGDLLATQSRGRPRSDAVHTIQHSLALIHREKYLNL